MNSKVLVHTLCIIALIIPMVARTAEFGSWKYKAQPILTPAEQLRTRITWINATDRKITMHIRSSNRNYEDWKRVNITILPLLAPHMKFYPDETIRDFGPYKIELDAHHLKNTIFFEIPTITKHIEIRIKESPEGSGNFVVQYRPYLAAGKPFRQQAKAFMGAAHPRLGAQTHDVGGNEAYKTIIEKLSESTWQEASPAR